MVGQSHAEGVTITIHAQPAAKTTAIAGLHGDALKIRVQVPPVDGKANAALGDFLAQRFGVAKSAVSLLSGETSRRKRFLVRGDSATLLKVLEQLIHTAAP